MLNSAHRPGHGPLLALWTIGNRLGTLDRGWKTLENRCSPRQQSRFCLAAAIPYHNCMHRHAFQCQEIDTPMHAGVWRHDTCLRSTVCLNSHFSGAVWRGCTGLVFAKQPVWAGLHVCLLHARSPWTCQARWHAACSFTCACSHNCLDAAHPPAQSTILFCRLVRLYRLAFAAA